MAKIDPYLRPLFDALNDMLDPEKVAGFLEKGVIEVAPLAFMRGRTLNDSFVILDEAQNTTPEQMKMFLTRLGFGSKMVITGDITQVDLPRNEKSGLIVVGRHPPRRRRRRLRALRRRRRRAPPPRAAHRRGLRLARPGPGARAAHRGRAQAGVGDASRSRCSAASWRPAPGPAGRAEIDRLVALAVATAGVRDGHVAIAFVDADADRGAQRASTAARQGPTDVLSFPIDEADADVAGPRELGDIVICPPHTEDMREAIVHGALHLVGMDHEVDDGEMLAVQAEILSW